MRLNDAAADQKPDYHLEWAYQPGNHFAVPTKDRTVLSGSCVSRSHIKHSVLTEVPSMYVAGVWVYTRGEGLGVFGTVPRNLQRKQEIVKLQHLQIHKSAISGNQQIHKTVKLDKWRISYHASQQGFSKSTVNLDFSWYISALFTRESEWSLLYTHWYALSRFGNKAIGCLVGASILFLG